MFKILTCYIKKIMFYLRLKTAGKYKKIEVYKKELGFKAGKNIRITGNITFGTEAYLLEFGSDITITQNVYFHTHDGGVWVFREEYPEINIFRKTKVGNNVFIGANSSIMPGVTIGDNVVIAAGSVVARDCDSDSVYGGVPARKIKTLAEYKEKVLKEAIFTKSSDAEKRRAEIIEYVNNRQNK